MINSSSSSHGRSRTTYRVKRDGTARPKSSLAKERTRLNVYILPALGAAWIGDLDLPELNAPIRHLTLQDGSPASGSTKSTVASVLRRLFAWAREEPASAIRVRNSPWSIVGSHRVARESDLPLNRSL